MIHDGDLVSLDCGLILDGWWADSGLSVACGEASPEVRRLIDVTRQALDLGIAAARPGNHIGDIGAAVQALRRGQRVLGGAPVRRATASAGTCTSSPQVPELRPARHGQPAQARLRHRDRADGQRGRAETRVLDDDWTVVTTDGKLSCYFEHTIAITESGPEVLTLRPDIRSWRTSRWDRRGLPADPGCGLYSITSGSRRSLVRRARIGVPPAPASRIAPGRIEHQAIGALRRQPRGTRHRNEGQSISQASV